MDKNPDPKDVMGHSEVPNSNPNCSVEVVVPMEDCSNFQLPHPNCDYRADHPIVAK